MPSLWGYPDYQARLDAPAFLAYAGFDNGPYVVWPDSLEVATDDAGRPDFVLSLVRRAGPGEPYCALELGLRRHAHGDAALYLARQRDPAATVTPVSFLSGYLRLVSAGGATEIPADLTAPTPIGWGGLESARWSFRMSVDSGELLKRGLQNQALLFNALAEIQVLGVAPRLPVKVQVNLAELVKALTTKDSRQVVRDDLVGYLRDHGGAIINVDNALSLDTVLLAYAVADRIHAHHAKFVPAPVGGNKLLIELKPDLPATAGWNLADAELAPRLYSYSLDPFDAARKLAASTGLDPLVREITVPAINLGYWEVNVAARLPPARTGILDHGVVLTAPAAPPARVDPVLKTIEFEEPTDGGKAEFRLSPSEKLQYTYQTFALLQQGEATKELKADPVAHDGNWVELRPDDFPLTFATASAERALLALAKVSGMLDYQDGDAAVSQPFALTAQQPIVTLAMPRGATGIMSFSAQPLDGGAAIALGPFPAANRQIGLLSFREYGPHRVAITCAFPAGGIVFAIDVLPEGKADQPENVNLMFFKPDKPTEDYLYLALSPFHPGYRWRRHTDAGSGAWSAVQSPFAPLTIKADVAAPAPAVYDLRGAHFYRKPDEPDSLYYLPGPPSPQTDGQGRPMLTLIASNQGAMLMLSSIWGLSDNAQTQLQADLIAQDPSLQGVVLRPAPVEVSAVTVLLDADGSGKPQPLQSTRSSGFPPYSAVFNLTLNAAQKANAISAVNGRAGLLLVQYALTVPPEVAATLSDGRSAQERLADVASWFPGGSGSSHLVLSGQTIPG